MKLPSACFILCVNRDNPWLSSALDSVLLQDDPEFKFYICANACEDKLWNKLEVFAASDRRVKLIRTHIGQLAFNLNLLANEAQCDYLIRMDADDICEPNRLRTLRAALAVDPVDIMGSSVHIIDADNRLVGRMLFPEQARDIKRLLQKGTAFCHPSVALRRQFLLDMRGYLGGFVSEDTDLWLRSVRLGATMKNLPDLLLRYRIHENQSIGSRLGYAEVAAHWLRELLIAPSWYTMKGFFLALIKAFAAPLLPGARRYHRMNAKH